MGGLATGIDQIPATSGSQLACVDSRLTKFEHGLYTWYRPYQRVREPLLSESVDRTHWQ